MFTAPVSRQGPNLADPVSPTTCNTYSPDRGGTTLWSGAGTGKFFPVFGNSFMWCQPAVLAKGGRAYFRLQGLVTEMLRSHTRCRTLQTGFVNSNSLVSRCSAMALNGGMKKHMGRNRVR